MPHSTAETAAHMLKSNLLTTEEAAAYLGIKPRSLEVWRCVGRYGIPFIKVGRLVKYRKADLDAFLAARTHTSAIEGLSSGHR